MIKSIFNLLSEKKESGIISVFDVDDTVLFTDSKIHYKEPGKEWNKVGTDEFSEVRHKLHPDTEYDFSEFVEYDKILMSIKGGKPNLMVLKELDKAILRGDKIGILTARGNQKAIWRALNSFLLYRDSKGKLQPLPPAQFNKSFVFAVGDESTQRAFKHDVKGGTANPSTIKAYILQKIFGDKMGFDKIIFFDDDAQNISIVKDLNDERIEAIKV